MPFNWQTFRSNPFLIRRLRKHLQKLAPDIIHAHADKPAQVLSRAGWPQQSVAIGTIHNIKSGYGAYRRLDGVIAVSRAIAEQAGHPQTTVVHNGVRRPEPDPAVQERLKQWRQDKPGLMFLAVGRLVKAKGFDILLRAWPPVAEAGLVILGGGKQAEVLRQVVSDRELQNVYLLGDSDEVAEWMAMADFLVISSRNEGGPYVLSEALLLGLPVISTQVGMVPDVLPEECMVVGGDESALARLINAAIANPDYYSRLCQGAIQRAAEELTLGAMMDATEAVYLSASEGCSVEGPDR